MVELKNISWTAPDGRKVLDDISLVIPDGKLIAITGPNGSGKTTLAKIIAGITEPDSGSILLDGRDISALDMTERAKAGISFAFQQPVRFKGLTVRMLLEIAAGKAMKDAQMCDVLAGVGLCARNYLDREVNTTLSGGEMKRIEIATVLARRTRVSIFDEPEAGIDIWSFAGLIKTFDQMRKKLDGTLMIVSHQERILSIADEIVLLAGGKVAGRGSGRKMLDMLVSSGAANTACSKMEV